MQNVLVLVNMQLATQMLASAGQPLRHCSTPVEELQSSDTVSHGKSGSDGSETAPAKL